MTARGLIFLCYILAIATIGLLWWYLSPEMVNDMLDGGEYLAGIIAGWVVYLTGFNDAYADFVSERALHGGRSFVVSALMLVWVVAIVFIARDGHGMLRIVRRSLFGIVIIHLVILALWLGLPKPTKWWYDLHALGVKNICRTMGWYRTETLARLLQLHSLIIYGEIFFVYLWLTRRRHHTAAVVAAERR